MYLLAMSMSSLKKCQWEIQNDRGIGGSGVHLSPQMHQEYILRYRSSHRAPDESRCMQNSVGWKKEGEKSRRVSGNLTCPWRWGGDLRRSEILTLGQLIGTEEKHLRLSESKAADPWQSEWSESYTDNLYCSLTCPGLGCKSIRKCSIWELEHRNWSTVTGWGPLLTMRRQSERMEGRSQQGMLLEENWAGMEAGHYCSVTHKRWNHLINHTIASPHALGLGPAQQRKTL